MARMAFRNCFRAVLEQLSGEPIKMQLQSSFRTAFFFFFQFFLLAFSFFDDQPQSNSSFNFRVWLNWVPSSVRGQCIPLPVPPPFPHPSPHPSPSIPLQFHRAVSWRLWPDTIETWNRSLNQSIKSVASNSSTSSIDPASKSSGSHRRALRMKKINQKKK